MTDETRRIMDKLDRNINDILFDLVEENETLEGQVDELREQVAKLAGNKGEWIPVSERLPEEEREVLCQLSDGSFGVLYVQDNWGQMDWVDGQMGTGTYDVIAWQPLPEPYKKGGE